MQIADMSPSVQRLVESFTHALNETDVCSMKEWLFALGSMSAILMRTGGLKEHEAREAMQYLATAAYHVYQNLPNEEVNVQ